MCVCVCVYVWSLAVKQCLSEPPGKCMCICIPIHHICIYDWVVFYWVNSIWESLLPRNRVTICFPGLVRFPTIISSIMWEPYLCLSSFWDLCNVNISVLDIVSEVLKLSTFPLFFFFLFSHSAAVIYITPSSSSLIHSSESLRFLLVYFSPLLALLYIF